MSEIASLWVRILGDTKGIEAALTGVQGKMERVGKRMQDIGAGMTKAVTLPLVAVGTASVLAAKQVEEAMATIRAGTGATGDELKNLGEDFRAVFGRVPENAQQVGTAIAELNTRLGLTGKPLQEMTETMLDLAQLSGQQVGPVIASTTRLFGDWSVASEKQTRTLDHLWKTSQTTGIQVGRLSEMLVQFGAPLRQFGFTVQEAAALMGKWEQEGVNTELVLGSLRIAIRQFAQEGVPLRKGLEQTIARIRELGPGAQATALAMKVFGRAGSDMAAAILEGRFEFDELLRRIQASPETIRQAGAETETFAEKLAILRNQTTAALEPIGARLVEALIKLMPTITNILDKVAALAERFAALPEGTQTAILGFAALAAATGPVVVALGFVVEAAGNIAGALKYLYPLIAKIGTKLLAVMGPKGWAIAGVIAAVALIRANWEPISAFFAGIWTGIQTAARRAVDAIAAMFGPWVEAIRRTVAGVTDAIVAPFRRAQEGVGNAIQGIRDFFGRLGPDARSSPSLREIVAGVEDAIAGPFERAAERVDEAVGAARGGAMNALARYALEVRDVWSEVENVTRTAVRNMENTLVTFLQKGRLEWRSLVDSIVADMIRLGVRRMMVRAGAALLGGVQGIVGGWFPAPFHHGGGVVGIDAPSARRWVPAAIMQGAPRLHGGYLAGDEYPAILQRGESVLTPAQMQKLGPAQGETHHHYYIQAVDARSFSELVERNPGAIARSIGQSLRTGGPLRDAIRQHT